jgi:hypothetical protein
MNTHISDLRKLEGESPRTDLLEVIPIQYIFGKKTVSYRFIFL